MPGGKRWSASYRVGETRGKAAGNVQEANLFRYSAIISCGEALPEAPPEHGDNTLALLGAAKAKGRDQSTRRCEQVILIAFQHKPLQTSVKGGRKEGGSTSKQASKQARFYLKEAIKHNARCLGGVGAIVGVAQLLQRSLEHLTHNSVLQQNTLRTRDERKWM
jgi:hypothetical protein